MIRFGGINGVKGLNHLESAVSGVEGCTADGRSIIERIKAIRGLLVLLPALAGCVNETENADQYTYVEVNKNDAGNLEEGGVITADAGQNDVNQSDSMGNDADAEQKNVRTVEPELQNSEYARILDTYPNLQILREKLLANYHKYSENDFDSWYRIVLDLVVNHYDPEMGFEEFVETMKGSLVVTEKPDSVFLIRVVQSLWVEHKGDLPWSLKDYSEGEIDYLFATNGLYTGEGVAIGDQVSAYDVPRVKFFDDNGVYYRQDPYKEAQVEEDMAYQLYPIARKLVGADVNETVGNVVRWSKNNFFHFDTNFPNADVYADGRAPGVTNDWGEAYRPEDLKRFFEVRAEGCHGPALLVADMLKVLNIPAHNYQAITSHGVVYIPGLDRFVHGDHISGFQSAAVEDELITPAAILVAAESGDEMMTDYLEDTDYCDEDASDGTYCPCRSLKRDGDSLVSMSFGHGLAQHITTDCLVNYKREMVSYNFRMLEDGGQLTLMSDPMRIVGLAELSDPELDIWKP